MRAQSRSEKISTVGKMLRITLSSAHPTVVVTLGPTRASGLAVRRSRIARLATPTSLASEISEKVASSLTTYGSSELLQRFGGPMDERPRAVLSGVFRLRDGVTEAEFLPALEAFYGHLVEMSFARSYRLMRRVPLNGFGSTLPLFEYHAEIEFPGLEEDEACYHYVQKSEQPVRSLHKAMNSKIQRGSADFFLGVCIGRRAAERLNHQRLCDESLGYVRLSSSS